MLSLTPTLPSILLGIWSHPMQEDLQSHSGEEGASIGTEGQSYELGVHQQQNMGAIGSTALSTQV